MPQTLQVSPSEMQIIQNILQTHIPSRPVWAFGSRANGKAKPYSDLDLAILGSVPLSLAEHANLAHDFSESDLPWKVDIVDWHLISAEFQQIIQAKYVVIQ